MDSEAERRSRCKSTSRAFNLEVSTALKLVQASKLSSGDNATVGVIVSKVILVSELVVVVLSSTVLEVNPLSTGVLNLASEGTAVRSTLSSEPGDSGVTSLRSN